MNPTKASASTIVFALAIFTAGFLCGVLFSVWNSSAPATAETASITTAQGGDAISQLQQLVQQDPGNAGAWRNLGNLYFDNNRVKEAIAAYNRAIELGEKDADLLTDLGVMYRRNGQPLKAIFTFDQAAALAPHHKYALFNKGIVLNYDLHRPKEALAVWESQLAFDPQTTVHDGQSLKEIAARLRQAVADTAAPQPAAGGAAQ